MLLDLAVDEAVEQGHDAATRRERGDPAAQHLEVGDAIGDVTGERRVEAELHIAGDHRAVVCDHQVEHGVSVSWHDLDDYERPLGRFAYVASSLQLPVREDERTDE